MTRREHNEGQLEPGQPISGTSGPIHLVSEGALCLDLINSEHFDCRGREEPQDTLNDPEWVLEFSQHWHLPVTTPPDILRLQGCVRYGRCCAACSKRLRSVNLSPMYS